MQHILYPMYTSRGFNKSWLPAVYRRLQYLLPPSVWISLMKTKMILMKKKFIQRQRRTLKFLNATCTKTACLLMPRTLEIAFPRFQISKFSGGACPQYPLEEKGLAAHLVVTAIYYTFKGRLKLKLLEPLHQSLTMERSLLWFFSFSSTLSDKKGKYMLSLLCTI